MPLIGDFHYIGHTLLTDHPACAEALAKYRINPGNVGFGEKRDRQFATLIEMAIRHGKPVRIGVNWGSLDQELLTAADGRERARCAEPLDARAVTREAIVQSALLSARAPRRSACRATASSSRPRSRRAGPHRRLPRARPPLRLRPPSRPDRGRHGLEGHRRVVGRDGILLQQGIGDTIRVSLTPEPGGDRTREVKVAQELLQTMGFRTFVPVVAACPGCGRTTSTVSRNSPARSRLIIRAACRNGRRPIPASRR